MCEREILETKRGGGGTKMICKAEERERKRWERETQTDRQVCP